MKSGFAAEEDLKIIVRQMKERISQYKRDKERKNVEEHSQKDSAAMTGLSNMVDQMTTSVAGQNPPLAMVSAHPKPVSEPHAATVDLTGNI